MKGKIATLVIAALLLIGGTGIWLVARSADKAADSGSSQTKKPKTDDAPAIELDIPQDELLLSQDKRSFQAAITTSDYKAIARVEFLVDGVFTAYSTASPFTVEIDISQLSVGQHTLQAIAYTFSGKTSKSAIFAFTITESQAAQPADDASRVIVRNSRSITSLQQAVNSGSSGSSGENNGGNNGGGDDGSGGDPDDPTTPWPDSPTFAQICGNTTLLSGPAVAPTGAVVVPAGDNSTMNLEAANTTYWFAPGVHTIGTGEFSQISPSNNSTYVGAPGAILDGQGLNDYAFTQHGTNVKIQYLTIRNFTAPRNEGVVNHDSGVGWTIEYNTVQDNGGGGVFAGTNNIVRYNCLKDNGQYGFQVYSSDPGGPQYVVIDHNEIVGNNQDDWESIEIGCGCTGGGKLWEANHVDITNNYVHNNLSVGIWADTNDNDMLVEGNYIADNEGQGLFYEIAYNMIVRSNNFIGNGVDAGPSNNSFPTGAIYLSEAGGDSRVTARTAQIEIYDNNFENNWAGVILWENADRFCGSPANTSGGTCTMVNPAANLTTCNDPAAGGSINTAPYYSDCRWKTQNVTVHDNTFITRRDEIPNCTNASSCGYQGIFSNVGTFPSWSPYTGSVIQQAITFNQNNHFSNNTYLGDWKFMAEEQGTQYNFAFWQGDPYFQDNGSTYNGNDHLVVENAIDTDSATLEDSIGQWIPWFSTNISRSNAEAHTGSYSLKTDITAEFGWGARINLANGYPITPSEKRISFWAKLGSGGANLRARMDVQWRDLNGDPIPGATTVQTLSPLLISEWQEASTVVTPPAGAKYAIVTVVHSSGQAGNTIYLDDFVIGDTQ